MTARDDSRIDERNPVKVSPTLGDLVEFGQLTQQSILLLGPIGSGKTTYAEAYLAEGLVLGFPAVFVTTDVSPRVIRNDMSRHGWPIEKHERNGMFTFVDGYSDRMGVKSTSPYSLSKVDDITELGIVLTEALEKLVVARVVVDSLTTLIMSSSAAALPQAVQRLSGRLTQGSHSIMYILEEGVHDDKTYASFAYSADAVLRFRVDDTSDTPKFFVRMERMRGTETKRAWVEFRLS
ncbi:MAG: RAD55 family ATPase [Candidatus Thorarchaeota archaeon]